MSAEVSLRISSKNNEKLCKTLKYCFNYEPKHLINSLQEVRKHEKNLNFFEEKKKRYINFGLEKKVSAPIPISKK